MKMGRTEERKEVEKKKKEEVKKKRKNHNTLLLTSVYPSQIHEGSWEGCPRWDDNVATRRIRDHTPHCCSSVDEAGVSSYYATGRRHLLETTQVSWVN